MLHSPIDRACCSSIVFWGLFYVAIYSNGPQELDINVKHMWQMFPYWWGSKTEVDDQGNIEVTNIEKATK